MPLVSQALQSLSRSVRDRGGVTDAMLRGADATLGLKRAEYEIERGRKADTRADEALGIQKAAAQRSKEAWEMGATSRESQKLKGERDLAEQKRLNEPVFIHSNDVHGGGPTALIAEMTSGKDGVSTFDLKEMGMEGSAYDNEGYRIKQDGTRVSVPRWKWEQKYKPALTITNIARTDPVYHLNDKLWEAQQRGDTATAEKISAMLGDKKQMAALYGRQALLVNQGLLWAIQNNADPKYIAMLDRSSQRSESKLSEYSGRILTEKENLELSKLKEQIETAKAQRKKYEAEAQKAKSGGGINQYQHGRLSMDAQKIVSEEIRSMDENLDPNSPWKKMTPGQKSEWKRNRLDEILSDVFPAAPETKQSQIDARAGLKPRGQVMAGADAGKEGRKYFDQIKSGAINPDQIKQQLAKSEQWEVLKALKSLIDAETNAPAKKPVSPIVKTPEKTAQQLRDEEESRRIEQINRERAAIDEPIDWDAAYRFTNRRIRK